MDKYECMPDDFLRNNYVPDVYQPSIYAIDYEKLKSSGIKLVSFDIDDTITGRENYHPPKAAKTLVENLKNMGLEVVLLTNARDTRGRRFGESLGVGYIAEAQKPLTRNFKKIQEDYGLEKNQMAHIGNSLLDDVAGGRAFGITTCLVRRAGKLTKSASLLRKTEGQKLRKELKKRGIWRKHHKNAEGDQYYQLGEMPGYFFTVPNELFKKNNYARGSLTKS